MECRSSEYMCDRILHGEARFYRGMLILCQRYHGDYACTLSSVTMSDGDGTNSNT
jgi:hypothetical protein